MVHRRLFSILLAACVLIMSGMSVTAEERSLSVKHAHTGKSAVIVFKKDGRYVPEGLAQLNALLADWRNGKQTEMDPALFDLLWGVYGDVGASNPITVVSSYRSPETNAMLREKSSGVAENSQHMRGKALDFYIPGVKLDVLRAAAMRRQGGGVGYYPTSGSPFVHLDTGSVRAWPRMTTAQLKALFPQGGTAHLPSDGPPLPNTVSPMSVAAAAAPVQATEPAKPRRTLADLLFGKTEPPPATGESVPVQPAVAVAALTVVAAPAPVPQRTRDVVFPVARPADLYDRPSPPMPVPPPGGEPVIRMFEADYALAYGPSPGQNVEDPFAFVHNLPALSLAGRDHVEGSAKPSGLAGEMHLGVAVETEGFGGFVLPEMSNARDLIAIDVGMRPGMFTRRVDRRF